MVVDANALSSRAVVLRMLAWGTSSRLKTSNVEFGLLYRLITIITKFRSRARFRIAEIEYGRGSVCINTRCRVIYSIQRDTTHQ